MNFNNTNIVGLSLSPCYDIPSLKDRWDNMVCNQATETKYYNRFTNLSMFPHDTNILLSHCPPFGYLDECVNEGNPVNIGSKGLLNLINIVKPKVVICGHVHEYPGKLEVILHADNQTTTVINVATTYKLLTIDNDKISIK